ncbi:hypothetical protein [Streptomyces sp. G-G2]|uniref:hypothetical protein n=1 Tax=Streptomyces sp. G-G2 TaxID=3046201 RepID=UPI0024BB070B|nr:hypothetical protein [Streptomyces sp. G-G2]MDJ0384499.1 hypothetical protein [Streptomyces sp. G-G2]
MNDQVNGSPDENREHGPEHGRGHGPLGGHGQEDELLVLRGLLHGAVGGLAPSDGALERLRHAVPARRARKRRVVIGAAAAVLLCGTAVPAALHLTAAQGTEGDHSAMAGHGESAAGTPDTTSDPHAAGAGESPRFTQAPGYDQGAGGVTGTPPPGAPPLTTGGTTAGPSSTGAATGGGPLLPPGGAAPESPGCGAAQLGVLASARTPDADGKVYGSFRVTNVSASGCTVTGPDTVTAAPTTGAAVGQGPVTVLAHTASDPATGLPDPVVEAPSLLLQPNMAYEVRFAWVPSATACTGTGAEPGGKPPQGGTADAPAARTSGADAGAGPEPSTGPSPEGAGVALTHTPQPGAPVTRTTIPAACGGTVYRTGVIALDAAPKP